MSEVREVHVVAGILRDESNRVLIAQRPRGRLMAGRWEFPGGKLQDGETPLQALRRELAEELGVEVTEAERLIRYRHDYTDHRVVLDAWQVIAYQGTPRSLDQQELSWVDAAELPDHDLLEADRSIVTAIRLPHVARVIQDPGNAGGGAAAASVPEALLWRHGPRRPPLDPERVSKLARQHRPVFVLGEGVEAIRAAAIAGAAGVIISSGGGRPLHVDPEGRFLVGVQCRDAASAHAAAAVGAHFVLLVPEVPISEAELQQLCDIITVPIWVGWYPDTRRLQRLREDGAHGCAIDLTVSVTGMPGNNDHGR